MARKKRQPTLWEIPDDLCKRIEPLINKLDPPKATGRPRQDARRILDGIIFRLRTGCQWTHNGQNNYTVRPDWKVLIQTG